MSNVRSSSATWLTAILLDELAANQTAPLDPAKLKALSGRLYALMHDDEGFGMATWWKAVQSVLAELAPMASLATAGGAK